MSIALYMDHHVRGEITAGLRRLGVDVITAEEDGCADLSDDALVDRATALGRVMFSNDEDMPAEAARRQRAGEHFAGLIFARQLKVTIGQCVRDLELIAKIYDPPDIADRVEFLPL